MNDIATKFEYQGRALTVVTIDGLPWFRLKEVCGWLEIANPRDAKGRLDEDEHRIIQRDDPEYSKFQAVGSTDTLKGGQQAFAIINESGLYTLIMSSRAATRKGTIQHKFRKWVTSEVLPAIRQTGKYEVTTPTTQTIIDPITGQTRKMSAYDPPITRGEASDIFKSLFDVSAKKFMIDNNLEDQLGKFITKKMKGVLKVLTDEVEEVRSVALNAEENITITRETLREIKKTNARQDIVLKRLESRIDSLTAENTQLRAAQEKTDRQVSVFKKQFTAVKEDIYKRLDVHRNRLNIHKKQIADFKETLGLNFEKVRRQFKGKKPH